MQRILLKPGDRDEPVEVEIEQAGREQPDAFQVRVGGDAFEVEIERNGPDAGTLRMRGAVIPFYTMRNGDDVQVWVGGRVCSFQIARHKGKNADRSAAAVATDRLVSPMPGTILKVNAEVGRDYEAHQPLVIMESMKMELTLSAPHHVLISEILCKPGQLVEMGALLARFKPIEVDDEAA